MIELLRELLPTAKLGLELLEVDRDEINQQLGVINDGLNAEMNGARWQRHIFSQLITQMDERSALQELVERYYQAYQLGKPVHEWSLEI